MPGLGPIVVHTGAAADERRRLIDLKSELARSYNADDESTLAIAQDSINSAIRSYNRFNWPWEVLTHSITLSSDVDAYALPSPFKAPLSAYLLNSGRRDRRLGYYPYDTFSTEYSTRADGEPRVYTLKNVHETGQITFWPMPKSSYSASIDYYRRTPILTSDESPIDVPPEAEEAIMQWAFYEFVKRVGGEFGAARIQTAYAEAREARASLVAMVSERGDTEGVL